MSSLHSSQPKENRLELLLFHLKGRQRFGINVLKVKEIIPTPHLTHVPHANLAVRGVAHLRGEPLTVIDLAVAIGRPPFEAEGGSIVITEVNRGIQGFLVERVDRIAVCDWRDVVPPPAATGIGSYITGVTRIEGELIQVLDVERIIGEVTGEGMETRPLEVDSHGLVGRSVLVVDDSLTARHRTAQTLDLLGVSYQMARDGREALELLRRLAAECGGAPVDMVISDIEMPEMNGYTLTQELRKEPAMKGIYVLLHTSLNGAINLQKAQQAGANDALTKFVPEELARAVIKGLELTPPVG